MTSLLLFSGLAFLVGAIGVAAFVLAKTPVPPAPTLGIQGFHRQRAMASSGIFASIEPALRVLSGWAAELPLPGLRPKLAAQLGEAGHPAGLTPDEIIAICASSALVTSGLGVAVASWDRAGLGSPGFGLAVGAGIGLFLPPLIVNGVARERCTRIYRDLSVACDLIVLCMSAGLDFPGAIRQITRNERPRDPLAEELRTILRDLDLGHPRRTALTAFSERVPTKEVREFVAAVIQAEEKGSPLAEILMIQSQVLRGRRSLRAEQLASKTAGMMFLPALLILGALMTVVAAPLFFRLSMMSDIFK